VRGAKGQVLLNERIPYKVVEALSGAKA
jgi:hypothetical protein